MKQSSDFTQFSIFISIEMECTTRERERKTDGGIVAYRKDKTNKKQDKEAKGRRRDSGYKHVHEHQFNSSSAIPLSSLSNYT